MKMLKTAAVFLTAPALATSLILTGCSSSDTNSQDANGDTAIDIQPTLSPEDYGVNTLPPEIFTPSEGANEYTAKLGQEVVLNLSEPNDAFVTSLNPDIVIITPGGVEGDAIMNPSARGVAVGEGELDIIDAGVQYTIKVTIVE